MICQNCQIKLDHHLFCDKACHENLLRDISLQEKNEFRRYALYSGLLLVLGGFVYFGLLADAFYSGGNHQRAPNLKTIALSLPVNTQQAPLSNITITKPSNGVKCTSKHIDVEGNAPNNSTVAIYLNGSLVDKTVAHAAYYRFPQVILPKRANVIQTRYYDRGSSEASTAILVFCKNAK